MTEHDELLPVFIEESQQHLQNIEPDLLALEKSGKEPEPEMVNRIFRGIHSIKGAAGFFGFHNIGKLSHIMESSLSLLRDGKILPTSELIDALLTGIDALKAMLDDAVASEDYDINHEIALFQKFADNADAPKKIVTVAEKADYKTDSSNLHPGVLEQNDTGAKEHQPAKFDISEEDVKYFVSNSFNLYSIKIFLDKDLRQKGKSPYEFINNMEAMGQYVDSFLDIRSVTGLSDCLDNDLAFDFLFATVLGQDEVTEGLGLPKEKIRVIDLDGFKKEILLADIPVKTESDGVGSTLRLEQASEGVGSTLRLEQAAEGVGSTLQLEQASDVVDSTLKLEHASEGVGSSLRLEPAKTETKDTHDDTKGTEDKAPDEAAETTDISDNSEQSLSQKEDTEVSESDTIPESAEKVSEKTLIPPEKAVAARPVQTEEKIRVGVGFLNDLMNLAGELVLGRNQLMQVAVPLVKHTPGLNPVLQHISRVTSEMQEKIMQMRMQPISLVFDKFHRVVRSLAKNHNKEVKLTTFGGDVELDKSIIEGLSDPLTHLIRNAVDHGIEPPEKREKSGKPRYGTIELKAYHQGGQVHLIISDDGKGVDGNFVAKKALEKGVINHSQFNSMNEKERVRLIFRPGFSTAEQVTDLSGRGVGMDVVITNIEHLGGTVDIETKVGTGTKVKLILPLTLAIVSGLLIKAEEQYFILPESDIDELVRVKPNEIQSRINMIHDAWVLRLRDTLLPLVNLNEVLGLQDAGGMEHGAGESQRVVPADIQKPLRILVVKYGSSKFGLIVDSIVSTEEIVVKPLPRYLKKMKCFSGVSILGNGKISLILDVAGILKKAAIRHVDDPKEETSQSDKTRVEAEIQTLLLFDNNTPERFAIPLELISRIERISASKIETVKDKQFLQYHDKKLRLIFLEDYLPITGPERTPSDTIGVIVPKQIKYPMGIVFHQVINTIQTSVELDTGTIMAPGLFGSAVLDGKITLLPDMYRMFEMAAPEWYTTAKKRDKDGVKRKYRILLTDDTPFFRMIESEYLTSAGYEVIQADNGKKAMQILEEQAVDAVVLDIVMPEMDGWEVIRAVRADKRLKHIPVIAVTSLGDEGLAQKGFKEGFSEWELKLDKTRLLEKLAAMLN